jgi:maltose O-acetyltransferase
MKKLLRRYLLRVYRVLKKWDQEEKYNTFRKKHNLHQTFRFNGEAILFYGAGELTIGENSYVGSHSTIQLEKGKSVFIGKNCRISHNVRIYTSSAIPDQDFANFHNLKKKSGDVIIEDNVWIGANVFINPGVTIGENAVIGANAVVTKDISPFGIYGGVPTKLIRNKRLGA